jgi:NAD(P)H dehydrogenase (quinone)
MPKVLIVYHSATGSTARLADAIAEGARSVEFTEVEVWRLPQAAEVPEAAVRSRHRLLEEVETLAEGDVLVLGGPIIQGAISPELRELLDAARAWGEKGRLRDIVGSAFTTADSPQDGHETTLWSIMTAMANLGMILVPPGFTDPVNLEGGSRYGATSTAEEGIADADLAMARHQGRRVATVGEWVRHAKSHGHSHGSTQGRPR